jgi:ABC-type transport system involved in multi-copper enzyme maturation permease subunit
MPMNKYRQNIRIIWAIAAKDIVDSFRNRTLLVIALGVMILMLTGPALSLLTSRDQPILVMFAPSDPGMFQGLQGRDDLRLVMVDSLDQLHSAILQPSQPILGVVVASGQIPDPAAGLVLKGYIAHWVKGTKVREQVAFFESVLSQASGTAVHIYVAGNILYPSQADSRQFTMVSISLMTMIMLMGLALVPYLFIEEKENHTMEALLVSPANFWQLVVGKMIAGTVYCLVAASIVLLFNYRLVVHWELMLPTLLLATLFAVAVGLLLGMFFDNAASLGLWTGLFTIVLLVSPLLETMGVGKIPPTLLTAFSWLPSSVIYKLVVLTMLGEVPIQPIWQAMLLLLGTTLVLCMLVVWRIRRMDR